MSKVTPFMLAKGALSSAFIGGSLGIVIRTWHRDSKRAKQLLAYAATTGVSGLLVGYTFASLKRRNGYSHGLSFGGNFFVISATFLVYRDFILVNYGKGGQQLYTNQSNDCNAIGVFQARHPMSPMVASAVSGGLTGFVLSTIFWYGPLILMTNSIQGIGLGALGQFIYDKYCAWRLEKVIEYNYPELSGNVSEVQGDSDVQENIHLSERLKRFLSRRPYSSHVTEEVRNLEVQLELLEEEQRRLQSKVTNSDELKKEE